MATPANNLRETIEFDVNVPVEVSLKYGSGKIISTRNGERVMFTTTDNRVFFLDLGPAQQINDLGVNTGEKFQICKRRQGKGPVEWTVWLSGETERARAVAEARRDGSDPELVGKMYDSIRPPAQRPTPVPPAIARRLDSHPAPAAAPLTVAPMPKAALIEECNAFVDAYAAVLERALSLHQGKVKPEEVKSIFLTVAINCAKELGRR